MQPSTGHLACLSKSAGFQNSSSQTLCNHFTGSLIPKRQKTNNKTKKQQQKKQAVCSKWEKEGSRNELCRGLGVASLSFPVVVVISVFTPILHLTALILYIFELIEFWIQNSLSFETKEPTYCVVMFLLSFHVWQEEKFCTYKPNDPNL